jgi:hypothetical protein
MCLFRLSDPIMRTTSARTLKRPRGVSSSNPAAGRNGQDARTIGRMDAIRNIKTMAGSPGAEAAKLSRFNVSQSCAWSFRFGVRAFANP